MAVPKRKMSRSNTRHRRSSWKAAPVALVPVTVDGQSHDVPRRLVRAVQRGYVDRRPPSASGASRSWRRT
jgi:large subunit ribosomal protein L32